MASYTTDFIMFIRKDQIKSWLVNDKGITPQDSIYTMLPIFETLLIEKTVANVLNLYISIGIFSEWLQHVNYRNAMVEATDEQIESIGKTGQEKENFDEGTEEKDKASGVVNDKKID